MIVFVFLDEAEACCPRTGVGGDGRANLEGRQEFHAGNRFLQQSIKAVHIVPDGICCLLYTSTDTNVVTMISKEEEIQLELLSKAEVAHKILDEILKLKAMKG